MRFDGSLYARALAALGKPQPQPAAPPALAYALDQEPTPVNIAAELCKRFEGFLSRPYLCPAGVPTIGYGATHYMDGRRVTLKDAPISREAAERLLVLQLERVYLPAVVKLCPGILHQPARRVAAILDYIFNLGAGRLATSTLRKRINADDWDSVPTELRKWVYGGGKVLKGLVIRRETECGLVIQKA